MRRRFNWWPEDSRPLAPAARATKAKQISAAQRVVITQRPTARSALVPAAMLSPPIRPVDCACVGAVGNPKLRVGVIALRIGDAGLARRKAVPSLVQPGVNSARIARTHAEIAADPSDAPEAATAAAVPAAADTFVRAAAHVVGLDDEVTDQPGREALVGGLTGVAST